MSENKGIKKVCMISMNKMSENKEIKKACMISTHGYFDAKPKLGLIDTGGQVVYVLELAKEMAKKGVEVDIYTRKFENRDDFEDVCKGVRIIRIPCGGEHFIPKEWLYEFLPDYIKNMVNFIRRCNIRYDVINSHYCDAGYVGMKVSKKLGIPHIHTAHSLGAWKQELIKGDPKALEKKFRFKLRIKTEKKIYDKSEFVIATTYLQKEKYIESYNLNQEKIKVVPCGFEERFQPMKVDRKQMSVDLPERFILTLGRMAENKGYDLFIKAVEPILKKFKDIDVVIAAGSLHDTDYERLLRKNLKHITRELGIKNRIIFMSDFIPLKEVPSVYNLAEIFVVASTYEPFGITAIEAMACKKPLVLTSLGGLKDFMTDRENAMIVDPRDTLSLSGAMDQLLTDKELYKKIAENGYQYTLNTFTWDAVAEKMLGIYVEAIKKQEDKIKEILRSCVK